MSIPLWAAPAPALTLSDGKNTVTISTAGVTSTGSVSTTSSSSAPAGSVTWSGNIGNFTVFGLTGHTKPLISSANNPRTDLGGTIITGNAGGTLTIKWSDVGFYGQGAMTLNEGTALAGSGSVKYTVYADSSNSLFGMGTQIATTSCTMSCGAVVTNPGPRGEYSMTSVDAITLGSNSMFSSDMQFTGAPFPSCKTSNALDTLISGSNVTAFVPNATWDTSSTAPGKVSVVPLEGTGTSAALTTNHPVDSCASDSLHGTTVCTSTTSTDIYLISGSPPKVTTTLTSPNTALTPDKFSGGSCYTCNVLINPTVGISGTALIGFGYNSSPSGTGLEFLDLNTHKFTQVASFNMISEGLVWDNLRNLILSPGEHSISFKNGTYDLFTLNSSLTANEFAFQPAPAQNIQFDSAAEDCLTGIALGTDEETANLFIIDLTQASFTAGTAFAPGNWTAPYQFKTITDFAAYEPESSESGISGVAIAQGSHYGLIIGEYPNLAASPTPNAIIAFQLPSTSGSGTPDLVDWVVASLPPNPANTSMMRESTFSMGCDPHGVTAYVSPSSNTPKGVVADYGPTGCAALGPPTSLAVVDLQMLLAAPRVPVSPPTNPPTYTHTVASLPAGAVTFVQVP